VGLLSILKVPSVLSHKVCCSNFFTQLMLLHIRYIIIFLLH